jgi:nucleotide-binding universal stress UspA family protein
MRALVWVRDAGWEACIDAAAALDADVTLLATDPDLGPPGGGLLGRHRPGPRQQERLQAVVSEAEGALLDAAAERLGRGAERLVLHGPPEDVVCDAAESADVLVLARDELDPGPKSLRPPTRFVVDHAPCAVLLIWPGTPPPPKRHKPKPKPKPKPPPP